MTNKHEVVTVVVMAVVTGTIDVPSAAGCDIVLHVFPLAI